jgi:predicted nucleotidyltransferase
MDFRQPVAALVPGARGRVLQALAASDRELSLSVLGQLAGVSVNQVPRVVDHLAALGVVTRRSVPPSTLVTLERGNLAARLVLALADLHSTAIDSLRELASNLRPPPLSAVAYGSFASGTAGADSDIDVAIVHADQSFETSEWASSLAGFVDEASACLGNVVSIAELATSEIADGALDEPFWEAVQATQLVLAGSAITKDLRDAAA